MSTTVLIVGSSYECPKHIARVFGRYRDAITITANGGYALFVAHERRPDYYVEPDFRGKDLFSLYVEDHRSSGGKFIATDGKRRLSFQWMIHAAIELGATEVICVGCEWFAPGSDVAYFDGRLASDGIRCLGMANDMKAWFVEVRSSNPNVRFEFIGEPMWLDDSYEKRTIIIAGDAPSVRGFDWPDGIGVMGVASGITQVPDPLHFVSLDDPWRVDESVAVSDRFQKHVPFNMFAKSWWRYPRVNVWQCKYVNQPNFGRKGAISLHEEDHPLLFAVQVAAKIGYRRCVFIGFDDEIETLSDWHPHAIDSGLEWLNASRYSALCECMPTYDMEAVAV